jgi:hypothetical protein
MLRATVPPGGIIAPEPSPFQRPATNPAPTQYAAAAMILEHAILNIHPDLVEYFEPAFREASAIIAASPGYLLLVQWQTL